MICSKCGSQIPADKVYCENCGSEAQLVPTYDLLDDELISMVGQNHKSRTSGTTKKRKKKKKLNFAPIIVLFIFALIITGCILGYVSYTNSFGFHLKKAQEAYEMNYLTEAIKEYKRCISMTDVSSSSNSLYRAYIGLAQAQYDLGDYASAEDSINSAIKLYPSSVDAYKLLLSIYNNTGNEKQINYLKATTSDPSLLSIINTYYCESPVFSKTPGDYDQDFKLFLSNSSGLQMFYTVDGSDPKVNGFEYKGAILIKEGITSVSAVCKNASGVYGQVVTLTYNVEYKLPNSPTISPLGGNFFEVTFITIAADKGDKIYYAWDDADPKVSGTEYFDEPILMQEGTHVFSAVAKNSKGKFSEVVKCEFHYEP